MEGEQPTSADVGRYGNDIGDGGIGELWCVYISEKEIGHVTVSETAN